MAPKRQKKARKERFRCDELDGEKFHAIVEDVFRYNWWDVFCFPYVLCSRVFNCCIALCAGTNQCLVYWMMVQWIVCKITRLTTPDPIIFPYYFYMFCQVILLTILFVFLWQSFGKSVLIPYFVAYYEAFLDDEIPGYSKINRTAKRSFRRYCFLKGEIFDTELDKEDYATAINPSIGLNFGGIVLSFLFNGQVF